MATDLTDSVVFVFHDGQWTPCLKLGGLITAYIEGVAATVGTSALTAAGTVGIPLPYYIESLPGLQAYWPMNEAFTQEDLVNGYIGTPTDAETGQLLASPDRWDFGRERVPLTVSAVGVGSGDITGTYRFAVSVVDSTMRNSICNYGYGDPVTVSGVDTISVGITGPHLPGGPFTANFDQTIERTTDHMWRTGVSSGSPSYSYDDSTFAPGNFIYANEDDLSDAYQARPFQRESAGHLAVGSVLPFGGTDPFSVVFDLDYINTQNILEYSWIVSCFNPGQTEGWGIAIYYPSYDSLSLRFVRRNAAGTDTVNCGLMAFAGSAVSYYRRCHDIVRATFNGSTIALDRNDGKDSNSAASTRSIDASSSVFSIGDGYVGAMSAVVVGNVEWTSSDVRRLYYERRFTDIGIWNWDTTLGSSGIAAGEFRFNNTPPSAAANIFIHDTDADAIDQDATLDALGTYDYVRVLYPATGVPTYEAIFDVQSATGDAGAYHQIPIGFRSATGTPPADGEPVRFQWIDRN